MSLAQLIATHGYWVIFLGTFLEGETILVLGGIAAHRGYLKLAGVVLCAFSGAWLCDQTFFYLGRRHGPAVLARRPTWRPAIRRVDALLERYNVLLVVGFRFLYGLRTVTPFAIGMSAGIPPGRFALLDALGAAVWAIVVGAAGYALGNVAEGLLGKARRYEIVAFIAVSLAGLLIWSLHFAGTRRRARGLAGVRD